MCFTHNGGLYVLLQAKVGTHKFKGVRNVIRHQSLIAYNNRKTVAVLGASKPLRSSLTFSFGKRSSVQNFFNSENLRFASNFRGKNSSPLSLSSGLPSFGRLALYVIRPFSIIIFPSISSNKIF